MKKILMTIALLCMVAQGAWAEDVNYIYYTVNADGKTITKHTDGSQADPTVLTSKLLEDSNEDNLNSGWYVLNSSFSYGERIVISGDWLYADGRAGHPHQHRCQALHLRPERDGGNDGQTRCH